MNIKNIILAALVIFVTSCNSDKKADTKPDDFKLEVEKSMNGSFSESFEVTNAVLKISDETFGSKLLVEVKRTSSPLPVNPDDVDFCGSSSGKSNGYCISADILGENNVPIETNLGIYGYDSFEKLLILKEGETIWLEFSTGYGDELKNNPEKAKKVKLISSVQKKDNSDISITSSSSDLSTGSEDWDTYLKNYEEFIDQYIKFMKKAQNGDMSAMSEYAEYMEKATALSDKMEGGKGDMSSDQMAKFLKLQAKLTQAAADMY